MNIVSENDSSVAFSSVPKLRASVSELFFIAKEEMRSPLGMHLVKYNKEFSSTLPLQPNYTLEEVLMHRQCLQCDCTTYHETTWICKHALVVRYHLYLFDPSQGINLLFAGSNLKSIGKAGRPQKKVDCLQNTSRDDEKYIFKSI